MRGLTYVCFGSSVFSCSIFWDAVTSIKTFHRVLGAF